MAYLKSCKTTIIATIPSISIYSLYNLKISVEYEKTAPAQPYVGVPRETLVVLHFATQAFDLQALLVMTYAL